MLIAISGTHGTGKSTILQGLEDAGFNVDRTPVSRTVQKNLGWSSLSEATDSVEKMIDFQEAILEVMYDRDYKHRNESGVVFVERSPADVASYATYWTNVKFKKDDQVTRSQSDQWLSNYIGRCRAMCQHYDSIVLVPTSLDVPFIEDPNRATMENRMFCQKYINSFVIGGGLHFFAVTKSKISDRVDEIRAHATILQLEKRNSNGYNPANS
jgi:predicted ATPase